MSFLRYTKHAFTEACKTTFDAEFPAPELRNIYVSIEYPIEEANYPGIWVDFEINGPISSVGIGHKEYTEQIDDITGALTFGSFKRWRFGGYVAFTIVALTSYERDTLFDSLLGVCAFGEESPATAEFRQAIEHNAYVAMNANWDSVVVTQPTAIPGTPWNEEKIVYEVTARLSVVGEFVSGGVHGALVPLSEVVLMPYTNQEPDPSPDSPGTNSWG